MTITAYRLDTEFEFYAKGVSDDEHTNSIDDTNGVCFNFCTE